MSEKKPPEGDPTVRGLGAIEDEPPARPAARPAPAANKPRLAMVPVKQVARGGEVDTAKEQPSPFAESTDPAGGAPAPESTLLNAPAPQEATLSGAPVQESTITGGAPYQDPEPEPEPEPAPRPKARAAPAPQPEPDATINATPASSTVILDPEPAAKPAPRPAAKPVVPKLATGPLRMMPASKAAQAEAAKPGGILGTLSGLSFSKLLNKEGGPGQPSQTAIFRLKEMAGKRGFEVIIAGVMLLVALGVGAHFLSGPGRPSEGDLILLYPYGQAGGTLPNGRPAPPATDVQYDFVAQVPCGEEQCLKYHASKPGTAFSLDMVVRHKEGEWRLVTGLDR